MAWWIGQYHGMSRIGEQVDERVVEVARQI